MTSVIPTTGTLKSLSASLATTHVPPAEMEDLRKIAFSAPLAPKISHSSGQSRQSASQESKDAQMAAMSMLSTNVKAALSVVLSALRQSTVRNVILSLRDRSSRLVAVLKSVCQERLLCSRETSESVKTVSSHVPHVEMEALDHVSHVQLDSTSSYLAVSVLQSALRVQLET